MSKQVVNLIYPALRAVFIIVLCIIPFGIAANSNHSYFGMDVYQRQLQMVSGYGKGMFNKHIPEGNVYFGYNFNEYIGAEIGQLFTGTDVRTTLTPEGALYFGRVVNPSNPPVPEGITAKNRIELHGTHLNILAKYPIMCSKFHFMGSIGLISLKMSAESKAIQDSNGVLTVSQINDRARRFSTRRVIPRFGGGLNYQMSETLGFRILAGYETTAKFKNIAARGIFGQSFLNRMSLKNNVLVGMGFTVHF